MNKNIDKNKNEGGRYAFKDSWLWGVLLFFALIFIDQLTKVLADVYFSQSDAPDRIAIIPGWIYLCITYNRGISYGLGSGAPTWAKIVLIAGTGVLMVAFAVFYFKVDKRRTWLRVALVFVVAGGIGNLIDRVYYRVWDPATFPLGVRDMVDLNRFGFAVCNFADFFIVGGAIALVLALLFFDKEAMFPLTEKYKALAKEAEAEKEAKTKAKSDSEKDPEKNNG